MTTKPKRAPVKSTNIPKLEKVRAIIEKKFKHSGVGFFSRGSPSEVKAVVPTGITPVDKYVIGCGGLPVGRITEMYSEEGVGKTSLALQVCAHTQKRGGVALLQETEDALSEERARLFDIDEDELLLLVPDYLEMALMQQETALKSLPDGLPPSVLAWDSIAATPTKKEWSDGIQSKESIGIRSMLLGKACRNFPKLARAKNVAILWVNQLRSVPGVSFGDNTTTPGGKPVKFHASVRMQLMGGKAIKGKAGQHLGKDITIIATKNKMAPPWRKCRARLIFAKGWDDEWSVLRHAKEFGVVPKGSKIDMAPDARMALEKFGWDQPGAHFKDEDEEELENM